MIGYQLTEEQKDQIQGQEFAPYQRFNCVQDFEGVWFNFLTDQDILTVATSPWVWILLCPRIEYKPKPMPNPFEQE
jgi:hypothetical protein